MIPSDRFSPEQARMIRAHNRRMRQQARPLAAPEPERVTPLMVFVALAIILLPIGLAMYAGAVGVEMYFGAVGS